MSEVVELRVAHTFVTFTRYLFRCLSFHSLRTSGHKCCFVMMNGVRSWVEYHGTAYVCG